ncbi:MAG: hypothetical protein UE699_02185 [Bacilli bacterium]|nr:hypothetical protein [Bacilli bacterium]
MTLLYIALGCILVVSFITGVVLTSKEKKQKSSDIVDKNVVNNVTVSNDDIPSVQTVQSPVAQASQTTVVPSVQVTPVVTQNSVAAPVMKVEVPSAVSSVTMAPVTNVPVTENIQTTSVVFNNTVNPNVVAQVPSVSPVPVTPVVQQTVEPVAVSQPVVSTQTAPVVQPSTPVSQPVIQQSVPVVTQTVQVPSTVPVTNPVPVSSDGVL